MINKIYFFWNLFHYPYILTKFDLFLAIFLFVRPLTIISGCKNTSLLIGRKNVNQVLSSELKEIQKLNSSPFTFGHVRWDWAPPFFFFHAFTI